MAPLTCQVGNVRVHLVSDGVFRTDGGTVFGVVPRTLWERVIAPDSSNRIPMQLRCLLIEADAGLVLVDTGYGDKLTQRSRDLLDLHDSGRLQGEMAQLGFGAGDVRTVINTHLHGDHAGGNTLQDVAGEIRATFPNAVYMAQRLELADATFPNERTRNAYFAENYLPLTHLCSCDGGDPYLRVLHGDTQITPEVRTLMTPGHTRAHQSVIIESKGEAAIFLADAAPHAVALEKLGWVAAFDAEPLVSIETKRTLREWAWRTNALMFFQHDDTMAAGRMARDGDQWHVDKVA